MAASSPWQNQIVGYGEEPPESLLANPRNVRIHPKPQQDALTGSLTEIGWIAPVIVNRTTAHVVDGHARIELAISRGEPSVPIAYVEISPEQEALALAAFDPIGAMAAVDAEKLDELLREVSTGDAALQAMLDGLATRAGLIPPDDPMSEWQSMPEFEQEDKTAYRTISVHFADDDAVDDFARLIGQDVTDKTKYIWHPEQERRQLGVYVTDES